MKTHLLAFGQGNSSLRSIVCDARGQVARAIIGQSREVWLAADHSKFNRPAMVELGRLEQVQRLFTDVVPAAPFPALLAAAGVTLVQCEAAP